MFDDEIVLNISDPVMTPEQFRFARKRLQLTQQQLADLLGVSRRTVENYEAASGTERHRKVNRQVALKLLELVRNGVE